MRIVQLLSLAMALAMGLIVGGVSVQAHALPRSCSGLFSVQKKSVKAPGYDFKGSDDPKWQEHVRRLTLTGQFSVPGSTTVEFYKIGPGSYEIPAGAYDVETPFMISKSAVSRGAWFDIAVEAKAVLPGKFDQLPLYFSGGGPGGTAPPDTYRVNGVSKVNAELWLTAVEELRAIDNPVATRIFPGLKKRDVLTLPYSGELLVGVAAPLNDSRASGKGVWEWTVEKAVNSPRHPTGKLFNMISLTTLDPNQVFPMSEDEGGGSFHIVKRRRGDSYDED